MGQLVGNLGVGLVLEGFTVDSAGKYRIQLWYGHGADGMHICIDLGPDEDDTTLTVMRGLVRAARKGGPSDVRTALVDAYGSSSPQVEVWDNADTVADGPLRAGWVDYLRRGPAYAAWPQMPE